MLGELLVIHDKGALRQDGVEKGGGEREKTVAQTSFPHRSERDLATAVVAREVVVKSDVHRHEGGEIPMVSEVGIVDVKVLLDGTHEERVLASWFCWGRFGWLGKYSIGWFGQSGVGSFSHNGHSRWVGRFWSFRGKTVICVT